MNRNRYRLVFNTTLGMMVPVAETARRSGKASSGKVVSAAALALANALLTSAAHAELPMASANFAAPGTTASYQTIGAQAYLRQVGNKAIVNFQTGNISAGHDLQLSQVDDLVSKNLVQGAVFSVLARIHDSNPSVIAGSISQAPGQRANLTMVNSNGIAFMGGSQVNLNSFTASTLDIQDHFLDNFLPQGETKPQFENALDGGPARGFIKVFEDAQITAGSQGRVILIAPTVVNKGKVAAPDGQIIVAAASKAYLRSAGGELNGLLIEVDSPAGLNNFDAANGSVRDGQLDGQTVNLTNAAEDKLGHVTNLGELTTPRGNVTMVGYAVNQMGIARATTSVVSGGSVYLLAKDTAVEVATQTPGSSRAGRVVLGQDSLTEILPEVADTATTQDGTAGTALDRPSRVRVVGQDIRIEGAARDARDQAIAGSGARILAPAGEVELIALDNPQADFFSGGATDIFSGGAAASTAARVHIGSGARIDVSGLRDVAVAAGRSVVEIDLRGDELKDSPINQQGPLRGQKVFLDVDRALAESDAGKPTLVARDTLLSLKAQQQRTVAERSTVGGKVKVYSKGETIIEPGVAIDLSGGSLKHAAGNIKTTLLTSGGKLVDLAEANAEVRYDGIATRFVIDYGRWNRQEVIDLGQSYRYDTGFTEGKDAGSLETFGIGGLFAQPAIAGNTVTGERQRALGIQPRGARWTVGYDDVSSLDKNKVQADGYDTQDYKLNQAVILSSSAVALPEGFRFGDTLPAELKSNLALDSRALAENRVAELTVLNNQAIAVRNAIQAPQGGGVTLTGANIDVAADITASAGVIALTARNTAGQLADVLPTPRLTVADGVRLSTRGAWVNDLPGAGGRTANAPLIDGGTIALNAQSVTNGPGSFVAQGELALGQAVTLDADSGAWLKPNGKVAGGDGGSIALSGFTVLGLDGVDMHAYGVDKGGTLKLGSNGIQVGGTPGAVPGALDLDSGLFERGGFARYALTALTRLEVADGTRIAPVLANRELSPDYATRASGSAIGDFSHLAVRDARVRQAVNVDLAARQDTAQTGDLVIGTNAHIELDPGAQLTLDGLNRIDINGLLRANGGAITATSDRDVHLGDVAVLDVSGIARTYIDNRGLTQGDVLAGGMIDLKAATVALEAGSSMDVSGAAPVRLDVLNESSGLGRRVGSDAGTLRVFADGSIRLDGELAAQAGADGLRGGVFEATLGEFVDPGPGQALAAAVLHLAPSVTPGQDDGVTRLDASRIEGAGFDRIRLASRDAIMLDDGLDVGADRTLPLRELTLDAAAILTSGGDSSLKADTLRVGNLDPIRRAATTATTNTGTLTLDARLLDLVGKFELGGMASADLTGTEAVRFSGTTIGTVRPSGELKTAADLAFHGAVVAPASYSQTRILAPGKTVSFSRTTDVPTQPLSAQGSLAIDAKHIEQDGNLWAPFGQLEFNASESLVFKNGSLTSVAAAAGSLLPFGKIQNGREWVVDLDPSKVPTGQITQDELAGKAIRVSGQSVDMQPGAKIDLSGGGDLQAYEFTVGPGGSRDILADANTYAILRGYTGGFAPADAQEGFDRASGEAIYLSGVPGLEDGVYTLLPAHYALLPGAYAVKLDTGIQNVLPGRAYSRQDGVRVAAGYVTDTRAGAPKDANWQGVIVMTHDQVRARSEFTLTKASDFFADSRNRPQDAGLLSVNTSGGGADALKLDAIYDLAAPDGRAAQVDISALKLAVTSGAVAGLDSDTVVLDAADLNALGAGSLLLGGTRSSSGDTTTLTVGADAVTLANDATHALEAGEVMLAAKNTLTLKAGSAIDAQGAAGDAGHYETSGNGAFVRAASTTATFARSSSPDGSQGTLIGETVVKGANGTVITPASSIAAADSIALDATKLNAFKGTTKFEEEKTENGKVVRTPVAGNLAVGATRINFGAAPDNAEGITYSETELEAFAGLNGLTLTSYSTFDLYGGVAVGKLDENGKPVLQNLTLQGAGLAGIANADMTAKLNAKQLTLTNTAAAKFVLPKDSEGNDVTLGSGTLAVTADTLTLGQGDKQIAGFGQVNITANELVGSGIGKLDVAAPVTLDVDRISGQTGASQSLIAAGKLEAVHHAAGRTLAPVTALGAAWALQGTSVDFKTRAELPSGSFKLTATSGNVTLGENASVDVAGREVQFFDVKKPSWGGTAEFVSETGNVEFDTGSNVNVSAAASGDAGTLIVRAANGTFTVADGSVQGQALADANGQRGEGARADIDIETLDSFSTLNTALNSGGFNGERRLRVRTGDVSIAAADKVKAHDITIAADAGKLTVEGEINADGNEGGSIQLYSGDRLTLKDGARLSAQALQTGRDGGSVTLGSTSEDTVLAGGSIATAGSAGGQDGTVLIRASRFDDVALANLYTALPDTGMANNYAVSLNGVTASSLLRGLVVAFTPTFTNTASSKLDLSGAGAKDIWYNGAPVTANQIKANETAYMVYDGTRFNIVDAAFANRTATTVLGTSSTSDTTTTNYAASQPGVTSYKTGMTLVYTPDADNLGTTNKLNINALGDKDIKYNNGILAAGYLKAGEPVYLVYDGTAFQVALEANTPRATGSATALALSAPSAMSAGNSFAFVANANSANGSTTLTVNGVTGSLLKNGANLKSGDIKANDLVYASYDGTAFHVLTELAAKVDVGKGVRVTSVAGDYTKAIATSITGASSISVEAVRSYDALASNGGGVLDGNRFSADTYRYLPKAGRDDVKSILAGAAPAFEVTKFHLRPGTEIRYGGDIVLPRDINLADYRYGNEPGVLTVRADGNLLVSSNLSDGFSHATPCTTVACTASSTPATLRSDASWSYRLIGGADSAAADPLAVKAVDKDVTLAAGKLIRTGTGDIDIAAGRNIVLADAGAAIYTAGRLDAPLSGFTVPFTNLRAFYTVDGGDVRLAARGDVAGKPSAQLFSQWLYRQGTIDPVTGQYVQQPSWWVRFDQFKQGVGALGGGDVTIAAGGKVQDVSASLPTQARTVGTKPSDAVLKETGGGTLRVTAGGDVLGGSYYVGRGELDIRAGGRVAPGSEKINTNTTPLAAIIALGDARASVRANGDVVIGSIVNPHLVPQSAGNLVQPPFGQGLRNPRATLFSTYGADSGVTAQSLAGNTRLDNGPLNSSAFPDLLGGNLVGDQPTLASGLLPPTLSLVAFLSDVTVGSAATGNLTLSPSATGNIDLLAGSSIHLNSNLALSDMDSRFVPDATNPLGSFKETPTGLIVNTDSNARPAVPDLLLDPFSVLGNIHAATPVHIADRTPVRVYARDGDIVGVNLLSDQGAVITKVLNVAKAVDIRAGNDVRNLSVFAQHNDEADMSRIQAGRDVVYDSTSDRRDRSLIRIGGGGRVEVTAGRNIDLGTSGGIVSRGNIDNPNLPAGGVDIHLAAGIGSAGIDYTGALARLLAAIRDDPANEVTLWQARWLTGDESLSAADAAAAVQAVQQLDADTQRAHVRTWQFTALRETGRQANLPDSEFAGDFSRGYAALALLFPGIEEKNPDGSFKHYEGDINLFASRVKTENGGDIEWLVPGGDMIVGLANTSKSLVDPEFLKTSGVLGIVVSDEGDIKGASRDDVLVNQSRILTVGGGDVLLWSSEGDIDAGKGKKTASSVPPPIVRVDQQGNVTLEQQGAVTGSGIGALFVAGGTAGDVDLIAPKGTVNAGDAGIRAGNLNIAAQVVLGADNISVSGSSAGTPVADTSAVTAASSGASNAGDASSTTAALSQNLADAARAAEDMKQAFKPTFITAEVVGHGD
ncbi:MAG: filamentous hemagglutinin family protein [Thiobacillus sp.]